MRMQFLPIKTRVLHPPQDNLYPLLDKDLPPLREKDVVLVTSKILSIHQGRCVKIEPQTDKDALIYKEAEAFIPRQKNPHNVLLTIKNNTLIPTAGIDESNAKGYYILWPRDINKAAREICGYLKRKHLVRKLAIIITDSHTMPLRRGVTSIAIGFYGLQPLKDYRGKKDIFGRELQITQTNIVDALAAVSGLLMGEGKERTPITIIRGAPWVQFTNRDTYSDFIIPREEDIYAPLLRVFDQKRKRKYTIRRLLKN